jgi:hypothetical protein
MAGQHRRCSWASGHEQLNGLAPPREEIHDSATSPSADHAFNSACGCPIIAYEILARTFEFVAGSGQHERGPVAIRTHRHGKEVR